jgi:hypothetical protein
VSVVVVCLFGSVQYHGVGVGDTGRLLWDGHQAGTWQAWFTTLMNGIPEGWTGM